MIPLNSWQRLPPKAIWFGLLTSLGVALILIAAAILISGGLTTVFIYLFAIYLVGRSVLYFKTYAFLLTDKTLTTVDDRHLLKSHSR